MSQTNKNSWRTLDNAAKIFPATSSQKDTRVFRFYCTCTEEVVPTLLQQALDQTIEKFPLFLAVIRKGLFWFYLEKSDLQPVISEEKTAPCLHLYLRDQKTLLFQVTYYKKRINFEVFHALTDGTGASLFLQELVKNYLTLLHPEVSLPSPSFIPEDITAQDQESDGFKKYYRHPGKKSGNKRPTYQLGGLRTGYGKLHITEGVVSCKKVLEVAKSYGVSMTIFLTAVFLCAIHKEREKIFYKRPIALMVPVNLRKFFPSSSMLNFFGWIEPAYTFSREDYDFKDVVDAVAAYFQSELTKEGLEERFGSLMSLERNPILRFFPLELKNLGMQLGVQLSKKQVTAIFSNLGQMVFPPEYSPYLEHFGVFTSTAKLELSCCSYQDALMLSFASGFESENIERNFFRILQDFDISTSIVKDQFPDTKEVSKGSLFYRIFTFSCISILVLACMANYLLTPTLVWGYFVAGGTISMWIAFTVGFLKRHNLLKNAIWQMILLPLVCVLWDYYTGFLGWSFDYVVPSLFMALQVAMIVITLIGHFPLEGYMIYFILAGLFGLLPGLFLVLGIAQFPVLSLLCSGISFLGLTGLIMFKGKEFFRELYKKLHF